MGWKFNWLQWKYYHCKKEQANRYRDLLQQEWKKVFARREHKQVNRKKRDIPIIVSLTSIPERLPYLQYPIRCMLHQTIKPDKIVLYLDKERFADDKLPSELLQLRENGLEIVYVEDLGPHTKYFYALQTYRDCYVITIDDDKYYNNMAIRDLLRAESKYKGAICARRVVALKFTQRGIPYPYRSYRELNEKVACKGKQLLALGVGGVLYPPRCLEHADYDIETIRRIAYRGDDIWLKAQELQQGLDVVKVECINQDIPVQGTQVVALCKENHAHGNDNIIKEVFRHYNLFHHFTNFNWEVDTGRDAIVRRILTEWLTLYQKKLSIGDFLKKKGIQTVAIYGMARLGVMLQGELEEKGIEVRYGIDAREINDSFLAIVKPEDISEPVDLIIITAVTDFFDLKRRLEMYTNCKMEMLENIIVELLWENT